MILLLEDFKGFIEQLYSYRHIKDTIYWDIITDINQYKYEELGIDSEITNSDYLEQFDHLILLLDDYEKWTENDNAIIFMGIHKKNEYEDQESNKGIDEAKNDDDELGYEDNYNDVF